MEQERENNAQHFLDLIQKSRKGKFKIYIGMSAGVGKTYRMLREAHTLLKKGIDVNLHYLPVHLHPYYKKLGFKSGDYPVAEKHAKSAISLPIYFGLKKEELIYIINTVKKIIY